ncbi:MAG: DUF418 domain-containing protein [Chitinophagaceae bacterium]|nr:MAG: DUF418 domain-containing protein [Chitinophagaceae bacterium]
MNQASPLLQSERIRIIDALRGVAVLGILLMNIPYFAFPVQIANDLRVRNDVTGANYYAWWLMTMFFDGTMRGMFSMLFGAGSVLLLLRLEAKHAGTYPADIYYRRLIWLLLFGLINAFIFLWIGDILYAYAICGLFIFPFRKAKPKYLLILAVVLMLIANLRQTLLFYESKNNRVKGEYAVALEKKKQKLTDEQKEDKQKYEARNERLKPASLKKDADKEIKEFRKGYFGLMVYLKDINKEIQSTVLYNNYFFDVIAFFFFGMAFFKWGILTGERSIKFYFVLMIVSYVIGITLSYLIARAHFTSNFDRSYLADKLLVDFYDERRLFLALGHISLLTVLYKAGFMNRFFTALANTGQMAFTNYLMQSIICAIIFDGFGLRWFGVLQRYEIYYIVGGIWIFQIIFSQVWMRYFRFGPFEWAWRSLTYWKKFEIRRRSLPPVQDGPVPEVSAEVLA